MKKSEKEEIVNKLRAGMKMHVTSASLKKALDQDTLNERVTKQLLG